MKRLLLFLCLCLAPAWAEQASMNKAIDLVEWMFQRPLTVIEIKVLSDQKGWEPWAERAQRLSNPPADLRATLLRQFQSDPSPFATTATKMEKDGRQEIAPGLSVVCSEAFAEWLLFGMAVIDGEETQVLPGPAFQSAVQATLAHVWPKLPVGSKEFLTGFPAYWGKMRKEWPKMEFAAKNRVIIAWQNNLANTLDKNDRIRLAKACLEDLQEAQREADSPQALDAACDRLEFAARRLRRGDTRAVELSGQLADYASKARKRQSDQAYADTLLKEDGPAPVAPHRVGGAVHVPGLLRRLGLGQRVSLRLVAVTSPKAAASPAAAPKTGSMKS